MPKIALTVQGLKSLPYPESGRVDYQDTELPRLLLRVAAAGRKTLFVSYWKDKQLTIRGVSEEVARRLRRILWFPRTSGPRPRSEEERAHQGSAVILLLLFGGLYTWINLHRLNNYHFMDFDLAIFGQGMWLLSRGETPLVTIRGMHLFGEHATYIHLLLAPLYRLFGDVRFLICVQSAALGWAGWLLYRHAARRLPAPLPLAVLAAYLLHPGLQYTWLSYYHPVALAVPCLVAAFDAIERERARTALLWAGLAMLCKENVAVTVIALGLYALVTGRRRLGLALATGAATYLLVVMRFLFPWFDAAGYAYAGRLYGDFAADLPAAILYLADPRNLLARLATPTNARYLFDLFFPVAFLPLGAIGTLAVAVQLPLNLIAAWPYAHEIERHYVALILPFIFLALVRGLDRLSNVPWRRSWALGALAASVLTAQLFLAPPWVSPRTAVPTWRFVLEMDKASDGIEQLLSRIPPNASVSVHYRYLPHLSHRSTIYNFPDLGPEGTWPDVILVDYPRLTLDEREAETLAVAQAEGGYETVAATPEGTVLLQRTSPR